jgi:hypothetical protein
MIPGGCLDRRRSGAAFLPENTRCLSRWLVICCGLALLVTALGIVPIKRSVARRAIGRAQHDGHRVLRLQELLRLETHVVRQTGLRLRREQRQTKKSRRDGERYEGEDRHVGGGHVALPLRHGYVRAGLRLRPRRRPRQRDQGRSHRPVLQFAQRSAAMGPATTRGAGLVSVAYPAAATGPPTR